MKTYKTLRELSDAIESGELILGDAQMIIDGDVVYLYREIDEDVNEIFSCDVTTLVEEALDILCIPWEYA